MIANVLSDMAHLAFEKFQKDTLVLLNEEPLYAFLQVDSRVELTRIGVDVTAVSMQDGDFVLYLNPEGYLSYSQPERLYILKHEWTHWIDEHPLLNSFYIIKLWNLACDLSINQDLETSICKRPKDAQMPEMYGLPPHLTPEQYYNLLLVQYNQKKLKIHKSLSSIALGQNLKKEKYDESAPFPIKGMIIKKSKMQNGVLLVRIDRKFVIFSNENSFYDKKMESIPFEGLKEGDYAETLVLYKEGGFLGLQLRLIEKPNENDNGSGDNSLELSEKNINGDESNTDSEEISVDDLENLHPTWKDINKNSPEINKDTLDEKVKSAINHAGKQIPDGLSEKLKRFMKSSTNWKGELSIIIASHRGQKKKYTYRKRNKRNPYAPGVKKSSRLKIVIIVDTSISISKEQLEMFDAEIRKIANTSVDIEIIVIICDAIIRDVYKFNHHLINENITFSGRGGTDFRPPFHLIDSRDHKLLKIPPDLIIYLTDGGGVAPDNFDIPTLWVLTPNGKLPDIKKLHSGEQVEWGKMIRLSE